MIDLSDHQESQRAVWYRKWLLVCSDFASLGTLRKFCIRLWAINVDVKKKKNVLFSSYYVSLRIANRIISLIGRKVKNGWSLYRNRLSMKELERVGFIKAHSSSSAVKILIKEILANGLFLKVPTNYFVNIYLNSKKEFQRFDLQRLLH